MLFVARVAGDLCRVRYPFEDLQFFKRTENVARPLGSQLRCDDRVLILQDFKEALRNLS